MQTLRTKNESLYNTLFLHSIHQDKLLWSRIQLLIAIQGGALVAGYSQINTLLHLKTLDVNLGSIIMIISALFIFVLLLVMLKDETDRDVNEEIMDKLGEKLVSSNIRKKIREGFEEKLKELLMRSRFPATKTSQINSFIRRTRFKGNFGDVGSQKAFLLTGKTRIKEAGALCNFFTSRRRWVFENF